MNSWIAGLFDPDHLESTVAALVGAQEADPAEAAQAVFRHRIRSAEEEMARLRRALDAGWDPERLTSQYNAAAAEKRGAQAGLDAVEVTESLSAGAVRILVTQLGDMKNVLDRAERADLADLYRALAITFDHREQVAKISIDPATRVVKVGVRGGTCTLTTRISL